MSAIRRLVPYVVMLALLVPVAAAAQWSGNRQSRRTDDRRHRAPEFDPSAIGAIAVLLAGGGLMFSRTKRK